MTEDIEIVREAYSALKRIHIAANNANDELLKKNGELKDEIRHLMEQVANAENNLIIQKNIVLNTITSSQEKHERDYQEITILKEKIQKLKK